MRKKDHLHIFYYRDYIQNFIFDEVWTLLDCFAVDGYSPLLIEELKIFDPKMWAGASRLSHELDLFLQKVRRVFSLYLRVCSSVAHCLQVVFTVTRPSSQYGRMNAKLMYSLRWRPPTIEHMEVW